MRDGGMRVVYPQEVLEGARDTARRYALLLQQQAARSSEAARESRHTADQYTAAHDARMAREAYDSYAGLRRNCNADW